MWTLWPYHPGALLAGPNKQNKAQIFKNVFFNPTKVWKARMHDYDVQEAIYQNCETHGSYVRSSRLDQYWHILKMYSILEKCSLLLHMFEKSESMIMMSKKPFSIIVKLIDPWSEFQALVCDQYEHILKMYIFLKLFFLLIYLRKTKFMTMMSVEPST